MRADWIATHAALQERFHPAPERVPGTEAWRRYVEYNWNAVIVEMAEVHRELEIRPWKNPTGIVKDRSALALELIDVLHFVANIANAAGITDEEFDALYEYKLQENRNRLASGRSVPTVVVSHEDAAAPAIEADEEWLTTNTGN